MIPSLSIGARTLLNDYNHSATAIFWRSALVLLTGFRSAAETDVTAWFYFCSV